jgi:hypothetical protein
MNKFTWTIGINAFASIEAALVDAVDGDIIKVAAGTYSVALSINKSNITLLGANAGVNPVFENRQNESVLEQEIVVEAGITGFTLDGFELIGASRVVLRNNTANTTFKNNVMTGTSADGIIRGPELATETTSNVIMNNNYSVAMANYRFGWFCNVDGLEMVGNDITVHPIFDLVNVGWYY